MKSIFTNVFIIALAIILNSESKAQSSTEAIIIEQPKDVIECEGSLDQFLFVEAAPSQKQYKIAYRWLKDGRAITSWVEDFGQLTFDTLRYRMSGLYNAELFAFDPNWTSDYGSPFSFDSARVSPIVSSDKANLYVLQPPSFIKDIETKTIRVGQGGSFTFDANIYGEHNIDDPSYWTDIQWFKGTRKLVDGEQFYGTLLSGTKSSILTVSKLNKNDYSDEYRVRLSDDCDTIWSNEFAIDRGPEIILIKRTILNVYTWCTNKVASVRINLGTDPPNIPMEYQWYMNDKLISEEPNKYSMSFKPLSTPNNHELNFTAFWNSDFENELFQKYRVDVWPKGYKENMFSREFMRFVWTKPLELTKELEDEYTVEEGKEIVFDPGVKGFAIRYKWIKDGIETPVSDSIYRWKAARFQDAGIYYFEAKNDCGLIRSKNIRLTVTPKQAITGIENNSADKEISIYPNPLTSNSTLTISPSSSGRVSVMLVDLLGNKLADIFDDIIQSGQSELIKLNFDNVGLTSGTYYLIIQMGNSVETRQISVVR